MRGQDGTDTSSRCERAPVADVLRPLAGVAPPLSASAPGLSCLGGGVLGGGEGCNLPPYQNTALSQTSFYFLFIWAVLRFMLGNWCEINSGRKTSLVGLIWEGE